jgi:hypothetical protein
MGVSPSVAAIALAWVPQCGIRAASRSGSCTPGTKGSRLQPKNLDTTSSLQWQTMGEPSTPYEMLLRVQPGSRQPCLGASNTRLLHERFGPLGTQMVNTTSNIMSQVLRTSEKVSPTTAARQNRVMPVRKHHTQVCQLQTLGRCREQASPSTSTPCGKT